MGSKEGCGRSGNVGTLDARSACARAHDALAGPEIKKEAEEGQEERKMQARTRDAQNLPHYDYDTIQLFTLNESH